MKAELLLRLGTECAKSMKKGDAFLQELCEADPSSAVVSREHFDGPMRDVLNWHVSLPNLQDMQSEPSLWFGELLPLAGMAHALPQLDLDDGTGGWNPARILPDPDIQALACLRMVKFWSQLKPATQLRGAPNPYRDQGVIDAINRRLGELILEFPGLLHPRIIFDVARIGIQPRQHNPLPLLHVLASRPYSDLPSERLGFSAKAVNQLVKSNVLAAAITRPAPVTLNLGLERNSQGYPLMQAVDTSRDVSIPLVTSLVSYARMRKAMLGKSALITDPKQVSALRSITGKAFGKTYDHARTQKSAEELALLEELRTVTVTGSPVLQAAVTEDRTAFLYWKVDDAVVGFASDEDVRCGRASKLNEKFTRPDAVARLESAVTSLLLGAAESCRANAQHAILRWMMPILKEPVRGTDHAALADRDTAQAVLSWFVAGGVSIEELGMRVRRNMDNDDDPALPTGWMAAMVALETEASMSSVLSSASSATLVVPAHAPSRRRAL